MITSLQNQTIKNLVRLQQKKYRDQENRFLVEGLHMIQEAASAGILETVYAVENYSSPLPIPPEYCSQAVLNKLSSQKSDAQLIGVCRKPDYASLSPAQLLAGRKESGKSLKKFLLLDHIQDPGNAGTLIRSAYAFGVQAVFLGQDSADLYSPKTLQSTQGALFHLPCLRCSLEEAIDELKEYQIPVYAAALHQDSVQLHSMHGLNAYAVMIGNEGQGISPSLLAKADTTVYIEMQDFESLNAAVAGSIILYHLQF